MPSDDAMQGNLKFPVLETDNPTYTNGKYETLLTQRVAQGADDGKTSIVLEHKISGAPLIEKLLHKNRAQYACAVTILNTGYRRFHQSTRHIQTIAWGLGVEGGPPVLAPMIVAVQDMQLTLSASDGVSQNWVGRPLVIPKGTRLAIGKPWHLSAQCPYVEFDSASYTSLCVELMRKKGSNEQKELLITLLKGAESFSNWMRARVSCTQGKETTSLGRSIAKLTENEYKELPRDYEKSIFRLWRDIPPAQACRVNFWAYFTINNMLLGKIDPVFLAANKKSKLEGRSRIEAALNNPHPDPKEIDDIVRTILRCLGGLPPPRGRRSVYIDCPFSRAWWRGYWAAEICDNPIFASDAHKNQIQDGLPSRYISIKKESVFDLLRTSQTYWEKLVDLVVSKNSMISDTKVRDALVYILIESSKGDPNSPLLKSAMLVRIRRWIDARYDRRDLAVLETDELVELFREKVAIFIAESN